MAYLQLLVVISIACLPALISVEAEQSSVEEFEQLRKQAFDHVGGWLPDQVAAKIDRMVKLLEEGSVPVEKQGKHTLEYLRLLVADCKPADTCDIESEIDKVKRLNGRRTHSYNLSRYLNSCAFAILDNCAPEVDKRASEKLAAMDRQNIEAFKVFMGEVLNKFIRNQKAPVNYDSLLIEAVKKLDPSGAKKVYRKLTKKELAVRSLMEEIRSPCVDYLAHLDPAIYEYQPSYIQSESRNGEQMLQIAEWRANAEHCKIIVEKWAQIMPACVESYDWYYKGDRGVNPKIYQG